MRWLEALGHALVGKSWLRIGNFEAFSEQKQWIIVEAFHLIAPVFVSPDPFSGPTDATLNGLPL